MNAGETIRVRDQAGALLRVRVERVYRTTIDALILAIIEPSGMPMMVGQLVRLGIPSAEDRKFRKKAKQEGVTK